MKEPKIESSGAGGGVARLKRYAIQVVYPSGDVAYLRHGSRVGAGKVVQFRSRRDADVNLDFITEGLDGSRATVVLYRREMEQ